MSYHEWKSLARRKGTEASIVWVRNTQTGAEGNRKESDYEKLQALPESNSVKPTQGRQPRFGEASLEAAKNFLEDNKVIDQFVGNTVYAHKINMPKF